MGIAEDSIEERAARQRCRELTTETLADLLIAAAEQPRRFDKWTNKALHYEAAIRLRQSI